MQENTNGLFQRVINIITKPKQEFELISNEEPNVSKVFTTYALPLLLIPTIAQIIGYGLIGLKLSIPFADTIYIKSWQYGITTGLTTFVGGAIGIFIIALIIDLLATSFQSEKNFGRSFQLATYAMTPAWVIGILNIFPPLSIIVGLASIYSLVLLYLGLPALKKVPTDKHIIYFIVSLVVAIGVTFIVALLLGAIVAIFYNPLQLGNLSL